MKIVQKWIQKIKNVPQKMFAKVPPTIAIKKKVDNSIITIKVFINFIYGYALPSWSS